MIKDGEVRLEGCICGTMFGYTTLCAIGLRQGKSRCKERNIKESELTMEMKERNVCKHTKSHIEVIEK